MGKEKGRKERKRVAVGYRAIFLELFNAVWMLEPLMSCGCGNALPSFPGRVEDGLGKGSWAGGGISEG